MAFSVCQQLLDVERFSEDPIVSACKQVISQLGTSLASLHLLVKATLVT